MKKIIAAALAVVTILVGAAAFTATPASATPPASGALAFDSTVTSPDGLTVCHAKWYTSNGIDGPSGDFEFTASYASSPNPTPCLKSGVDVTGTGTGQYYMVHRMVITEPSTGALLKATNLTVLSNTNYGGVTNLGAYGDKNLSVQLAVCYQGNPLLSCTALVTKFTTPNSSVALVLGR